MSLRPPIHYYQHRAHVRTTDAASEPVTADELRTHLNETASGLPDSEADDYIAEAREEIERQTGLALVTQTWRLNLDHWPRVREPWWDGVRQGHINMLHGSDDRGDVILPAYPLQSITSVTVYDESGNSTVVTVGDVFDVDTYSRPGRMTLKRGQTWPVAMRANNAIEIVYVAGYGNDGGTVPGPLKRAVKQVAAYIYSHRGDGCDAKEAIMASGASGILDNYRVMSV